MSRLKTVTQLTSKTTAVRINSYTGIITTFALTDAAQGAFEFTVNNKKVRDESTIQLTPIYTGAGVPVVNLVSKTRGSFVVRVTNVSADVALNAALSIQMKVYFY